MSDNNTISAKSEQKSSGQPVGAQKQQPGPVNAGLALAGPSAGKGYEFAPIYHTLILSENIQLMPKTLNSYDLDKVIFDILKKKVEGKGKVFWVLPFSEFQNFI